MIRDSFYARLSVAITFGLCALFSATVFGTGWEIDTSHSTAKFKIRHMMVSNVHGNFSDIKGTIDIDDKDKNKVTADATIGVASINTSETKRDEHLKSADFFDATKFPTITFKSKKSAKDGKKTNLTGDMTMHGVTKEVTFSIDEMTGPVKGMDGNPRRGLSASGKVNRKDFGVTWNKVLDGGGVALGDTVDVTVELELKPAPKSETKG